MNKPPEWIQNYLEKEYERAEPLSRKEKTFIQALTIAWEALNECSEWRLYDALEDCQKYAKEKVKKFIIEVVENDPRFSDAKKKIRVETLEEAAKIAEYESYYPHDRMRSIVDKIRALKDKLAMEEMNKGNEVGYPQYCGICMKRIYMYTVVRDTKYCADCRLKLDGYVPK